MSTDLHWHMSTKNMYNVLVQSVQWCWNCGGITCGTYGITVVTLLAGGQNQVLINPTGTLKTCRQSVTSIDNTEIFHSGESKDGVAGDGQSTKVNINA